MDATIRGFAIYGTIDRASVKTRESCSEHADVANKVCSEVFHFCFAVFACLYLHTRRSRDPYLVASYLLPESLSDPTLRPRRVASCCALWVAGVLSLWVVVAAWAGGRTTPRNVAHSLTFFCVVGWVLVVLNRTLQVDRLVEFAPSLAYHHLWSTAALVVVWLLSFLFYLTVEGYSPKAYELTHL
eukprot:CAMPEP_0204329928 /NCGR_PEP_ID=MMETSP0469-20131031/14529_1 /ASSEMBLY_ACC=CAM_ASM_000384 /TAXON_ID=2969 /ORGANISM="Oxyrrhis marina" /LENGTH=184 /DNA_ID=CAMNT_0051312621 /DNA_START=72 /DNA_END=622 /DNA_ORIENTATION=+